MEWCIESPLHITFKPTTKLKSLIRKSRSLSFTSGDRAPSLLCDQEVRLSGNCNYRSWRSYAWRLMRTPESTRKRILRKEFKVGQKALLFNSQLKFITCKLRSRWDGPFVVTNVFPYGVIEVRVAANNNTFKVNGHQLKPYHEGPIMSSNEGEMKVLTLRKSVILEDIPKEIPKSPNA
ncbi:hypothetical protein CR513_14838, partial [Mucuna pruriens]